MILSFALAATSLAGCASDDDGRNDDIVLLDPVSVSVSSEVVSRRDIYNAKVVSAIVCPKVTEGSFERSINFSSYVKMPGEFVEAGAPVITGDTKSIDKQIKELTKSIKRMEINFNETVSDLRKEEEEKKAASEFDAEHIKDLEEQEPEKTDPNYKEWKETYDYRDLLYRNSVMAYEWAKLNRRETEEQYSLEHSYQLSRLNDLNRQKNELMLLSDTSGEVVALGYWNYNNYIRYYEPGDYINKNTVGVAVGDTSIKELRCDFVSQGDVNKAQDIYAIVNGKRYEVQYQSMSTEEYKKLLEKNDVVYGTFTIDDPFGEVNFGDYAVIVMINEEKKGVLCVPNSAVGTANGESYVYVAEGESYKERTIRTGASDGAYTEVLSGVDEGEVVKADFHVKNGARTTTLQKGSISNRFTSSGYLYYPSPKRVENPIEYGVTYIDEICVKRYQEVTEGQVIARVHVVPDQIEIDRNDRQLLRLNQRLAELVEKGEEENKAQIRDLREQIADVSAVVTDMRNDAKVTEIVAFSSGIITDVLDAEAGDLLKSGDAVARLSDESSSFIVVQDEDKKLSMGNKVNVTYTGPDGNKAVVEGEVVTANAMTLSRDLQADFALVRLPAEVVAAISGTNQDSSGWWNITWLEVEATLRSMDNVILIPKSAVYEVKGSTYVTVRDENGALRMVSFIAGGSDLENYWVAEGLEEGMTICWE